MGYVLETLADIKERMNAKASPKAAQPSQDEAPSKNK